MSITSLPEWIACRAISSWSKQYSAAEKIFKSASAADLDDLIQIVESGSLDNQHVALSTLEHFSRAKLDARWTLDRRDRLVHVLRKHLVERYSDDVARHSVSVLRIMDFVWLDEFLTGIQLEQVSEEGRTKLIYDLSNHPTESSRARLLLIMKAGWEEAAQVKWPVNAAPDSLPPQPAPDEWDYNPHTKVTGPLLSSPEWKHLRKSQRPSDEVLLWLDSVTYSDVADVAEAWEGNDSDDRRLAGVVIRQLGARSDARLADHRARILERAQSLATKSLQETGILPSEYYVIRDISREQAIDFVLACLQRGEFNPGHLQDMFREMMTLGGLTRIEQLAAQGGLLAEDAATYLDQCGPITPEKIAAKSEHWRKSHDAQHLKWLFHRHIESNAPQSCDIHAILTLLGEPSERGEHFFSWKSKGSRVHLHMETDKSGKLGWMRLYED